MTDPVFKAAIRPKLPPAAQELVDAYESVQGGKRFPCLPEGIAAVLDHMAVDHGKAPWFPDQLHDLASALRGEVPQ